MTANLVSIVTPAYNAEKYIAASISSVFNQTYQNWELIIINDGSKDTTEEIVKSFLHDNRIRYYSQQNTGVSMARNNGIKKAKGDFIAFLDADDVWEVNNLRKKIELLNEKSEIGWVFSDMYNADKNLNKTGIAPLGTDKNILEDILLWEHEVVPGPCSNLVIKKKCIDAGVAFDHLFSTAADQDFCIQLASTFKGKRIPEPLFTYRTLQGSMSRNIAAMEHDHILVYEKAVRNRLFKSFWFRKKCFSNLYLILAGSWWVNGNNKLRGIYFIFLAIISYPPAIIKVIKKFIK